MKKQYVFLHKPGYCRIVNEGTKKARLLLLEAKLSGKPVTYLGKAVSQEWCIAQLHYDKTIGFKHKTDCVYDDPRGAYIRVGVHPITPGLEGFLKVSGSVS